MFKWKSIIIISRGILVAPLLDVMYSTIRILVGVSPPPKPATYNQTPISLATPSNNMSARHGRMICQVRPLQPRARLTIFRARRQTDGATHVGVADRAGDVERHLRRLGHIAARRVGALAVVRRQGVAFAAKEEGAVVRLALRSFRRGGFDVGFVPRHGAVGADLTRG